jgi:predicted RNA-binding protein with PIN domain
MMKKIIIDGHNLIPKIPGMRLSDMDDEQQLIGVIQEYCRIARRQTELFFDGGLPTNPPGKKGGLVHTHFIKANQSADDAIIAYLRASGNSARNLLVVTSDHRILIEAVNLGAECMTSEAFAAEIKRVFSSPQVAQELREKRPSEIEVEEWIRLFSGKSGE